MNSFQMKILACLFMLIDHMGVILFPQYIAFRIIGRLAFPIFAWMISEGYRHSRNHVNYMKRLAIFAVAVQIPYYIQSREFYLNIFFTLFLGLLTIYVYDKLNNKLKSYGIIALVAIIAEVIHADYGAYGVLTIFMFHLFHDDFKSLVTSQAMLNLVYFVVTEEMVSMKGLGFSTADLIQLVSLFSLAIIYFYNGQRGKKVKYAFYVFYPAHLALLYLIKISIFK